MRPAGLTAVCIIAIVMGVIGAFTNLLGVIGMVIQPYMSDFMQMFMSGMPGQPAQVQQQLEQQRVIMDDMAAIQQQWMPFIVAAMVVLMAAVLCMIYGGIQGLRLKPKAHWWMIGGMCAAMLHGMINGYYTYGTQRDSHPVMVRHMNQTLQAGGAPAPPAARAMTNSAMQFGTAIGLVFIILWIMVKCCLYGSCIWYLLTPKIRQLFESDGSDRAIIDALSEAPT